MSETRYMIWDERGNTVWCDMHNNEDEAKIAYVDMLRSFGIARCSSGLLRGNQAKIEYVDSLIEVLNYEIGEESNE